jgi:hypothetical protein
MKCKTGADILSKAKFMDYFFFVLHGEKTVGVVGVSKLNNGWILSTLGRASADYGETISSLRQKYPESEGYQVEIIGLYTSGWIIMASNPTKGEYLVTTNDKRTIREYDLPSFADSERNIVSLDVMLPKFVNEAKETVRLREKYQGNKMNEN